MTLVQKRHIGMSVSYNCTVVIERKVILKPKLNGITRGALLFQPLYYICKPERKSDLGF